MGHLFQGRYKAVLVRKESYLRELARYVVLNPVRAAIVREPGEWPWSSYRLTAGEQNAVPEWVDVDWLLSGFGKGRSEAIAAYSRFVRDGVGLQSPLEQINEAMARAYLSGAYTMQQIGEHFGVQYMTVSRAVRGFE